MVRKCLRFMKNGFTAQIRKNILRKKEIATIYFRTYYFQNISIVYTLFESHAMQSFQVIQYFYNISFLLNFNSQYK